VKILFVSHRPPGPPDKGDKIRSHHLLKRLAARHRVEVACLYDEDSELETMRESCSWAAELTARRRPRAEGIVRGLMAAASGRSLTSGYFHSTELSRSVDRILQERTPDVALAYCSGMAGYLKAFDGARVLDLVDVDSEKWRQYACRARGGKRLVYALEARLLRADEQRLVGEFDRSIVVSDAERDLLAGFCEESRIDVVPMGVDLARLQRGCARPGTADLVFVGALDYLPNSEGITAFAREVFPAVRRRFPTARLRIVGRRPGAGVRALSGLPGVEVAPDVPDVRNWLWGAAIAVVPLRIAQGVQNKVLEAMAAGVPVVASHTATRGIDAVDAEHLHIAEDSAGMVAKITHLLENPIEADAMAKRALEFVRAHHDWDTAALAYERVLQSALEQRGPSKREGGAC
jgi:sugar transferase (PEP-CTERM/EpsH1 system associated)